MEFGRLGESRVRGPGEVPVRRYGPICLPSSPKKMGSESAQALKIFFVPTIAVFVSKYFLKSTNRLNFAEEIFISNVFFLRTICFGNGCENEF